MSGSTVDNNQFGSLITPHNKSDFLVDVLTSFCCKESFSFIHIRLLSCTGSDL